MVQGLSHNDFIQGMEKELERTEQISDLLWRLSWQEMDTEGEENVSSFHGQMNGCAQKEQWDMNRLEKSETMRSVCFGNVRVDMLNGLMDTYGS